VGKTDAQVVNEETVLAVGFFILVAVIAKTAGAPYTAWAESHIQVRRQSNAFPAHTDGSESNPR